MVENSSDSLGMRRKPRQVRSQERVNRILDVAEQMFVEDGYEAATTNAISTRANVSIGSLYQFFPDKSAILQALAARYRELLRQRLAELNTDEALKLSLPLYVDRLIHITDQFFSDHPGYHAIFITVQGKMPEIEEIEDATDMILIEDLALFLSYRYSGLAASDYQAIAFVLVKAIGTLLWLSIGKEPLFRRRLVAETKRLTQHYLESYF